MKMYETGLSGARFFVPLLAIAFALGICCVPALAQTQETQEAVGVITDIPEIYQYGSDNYDPMLQRVRVLVRANVLDLAQSILENEGPPSLPNQQWLDWERQLWTLYRVREDWNTLYERTRSLPPAFPVAIKAEADSEAINASISSDQGKKARSLLRKNLTSPDISELDKRKHRKTLIESYLADNLLFEAGIAMDEYQSDYRSGAEDWLLLSARVNLRLNDADKAVNLLAPLEFDSARLLRIYARLRNNTISPENAVSRAGALLEQQNDPNNDIDLFRHQILSVIVFAELQAGRQSEAIDAMEQYLISVNKRNPAFDDGYPRYGEDDLLAAYSAFSKSVAGDAGMEGKSDAKIFSHAIQQPEWKVITRKSLYGDLLQRTDDDDLRIQINDQYVMALVQSDRTELVELLFGDENPFGKLVVSGNTGMQLSNISLQNGDATLASQVSAGLTESPDGMDPLDWMLHVARISIIAGDYDQGVDNLSRWLDAHEKLTPTQADRVLQPIFDLQTVHQHDRALDLLHRVYYLSYHSTKHRREIAYWIAESYWGTEDYLKAADYYLFSAMQKEDGFDRWGRSARYRAAESLQSAMLIADARKLVEGLLLNADDEGRRIQLQHKIQELWLLESESEKGDSP